MKEKILLSLLQKLLTKERIVAILRGGASLTEGEKDDEVAEMIAKWLGVS
jgi:hypothetical protein